MATMMSQKKFCERMYGVYSLLGGNRCAQCFDDRFSCGYTKDNTSLTNTLVQACIVHNVKFTMTSDGNCINLVVDFNE